jgi:hypothetical protein
MLNEGGMVAAVVGAFGASGALAYFLYHPHQVNHHWSAVCRFWLTSILYQCYGSVTLVRIGSGS